MRKHLIFVISALVLAVIQTTLVPLVLPAWLRPDFLLILVVLLGLFAQPATGAVYAFGLGYLQDLLTGSMPGLFTFDRLVIYIAAYWLSGQFYARSPFAQALLVALLSVTDYFLIWLLSAIFSGGDALGLPFWQMLPRSIVCALIGLLLYFPLDILWEGGEREL